MATMVRNSTRKFTRNELSSENLYRNHDADISVMTSLAASQRKVSLNRYVAELSISTYELASQLELSHERTLELLNGNVRLSNELATHIEEMLSLPPSWLDHGGPIRQEHPESGRRIESLPTADVSDPHKIFFKPSDSGSTPSKEKIMNISVPDVEMAQEVLDETRKRVKPSTSAHRRENLVMLTERRGSKNVLATLSNMNGSRISLMTSGRKPVSDRFSTAIEQALLLPSGWLDNAHTSEDVPNNVWKLLGCDRREKQSPSKKTSTNLHIPQQPTAKKVVSIFEKTPGQAGPIAEALAKTVLRLSASDQLSESKAFQLLGLLVD